VGGRGAERRTRAAWLRSFEHETSLGSRTVSLLRTEPPAPVRSLEELFAIAEAMEQEAAARYTDLAAQMRNLDLPDVARTFEALAAEERGHAGHVAEWSRSRTGAVPDLALIPWRPPETFDEEEARDFASSRLASAYRALSMAVRNEERAFALWTYIAAQSEDRAIREAAERMAGEELHHAALLRRARRQAFHAGRRGQTGGPRQPPLAEAALAEAELARLLGRLAAQPSASGELGRLAVESAGMAEEAARLAAEGDAPGPPAMRASGTAESGSLADALRWSERTIEAYLAIAGAAPTEDAMARTQRMAARAIERAAALRRMAGIG
jgi:rubrerythrin